MQFLMNIAGGGTGMVFTVVFGVAETFVQEKIILYGHQNVKKRSFVEIRKKGISTGRTAENLDNLFFP